MKTKAVLIGAIAGVIIIAVLSILLVMSKASQSQTESDNNVLRNDNALQGQVIATQSLVFKKLNLISAETSRQSSLIGVKSEETVIKYRETIRNEKTCDLLVPGNISRGLLEYTARIRTSAMHAAAGRTDESGTPALPTSSLTYCQAVLWIDPLLSVIEVANTQLAGIREAERMRTENPTTQKKE